MLEYFLPAPAIFAENISIVLGEYYLIYEKGVWFDTNVQGSSLEIYKKLRNAIKNNPPMHDSTLKIIKRVAEGDRLAYVTDEIVAEDAASNNCQLTYVRDEDSTGSMGGHIFRKNQQELVDKLNEVIYTNFNYVGYIFNRYKPKTTDLCSNDGVKKLTIYNFYAAFMIAGGLLILGFLLFFKEI